MYDLCAPQVCQCSKSIGSTKNRSGSAYFPNSVFYQHEEETPFIFKKWFIGVSPGISHRLDLEKCHQINQNGIYPAHNLCQYCGTSMEPLLCY